jgi:antitoxin component YwqK of YwqJK toxin-antitoxin module
MKKEEIICISIGNTKYFYKAALLATQEQSADGCATDGKIPDGGVKEFYAASQTDATYKNGVKSSAISREEMKILNEKLQKESEQEIAALHNAHSFLPHTKTGFTFTTSFSDRIFYINGKEVGRQILDPAGYIVETQGKPFTGTGKDFYVNGGLKQEAYFKKGVIEGKVKTYDLNGRILSVEKYKNGLKEGEASVFNFTEGILTEQKLEYSKGMLNGTRRAFGINGSIIGIEHFKNDKLNGVRETFYFNGQKESRSEYKDGLLEGKRLFYYDNGQINYEENFLRGKLEGKRTAYYPDGKIFLAENYKNDRLDGERIVRDEQGKVKTKQFYKNGALQD